MHLIYAADKENFIHNISKQVELACALLNNTNDEKLQQVFILEKYGNTAKNIIGITEHIYYHIGQIVLLLKHVYYYYYEKLRNLLQ
jgi:adenine deaminase